MDWRERGKILTSFCMTRPRGCGLIMTRSMPMLCRAIFFCVAALALCAQTPKQSLADLIEEGNRKAALALIRAGADVNAAQPDGTRPIHWAVVRVDYILLEAL